MITNGHDYAGFLAGKTRRPDVSGCEPLPVSPVLYPFQRDIVRWAVRLGRAGIFADTGLGKTLMQLEWSRHVVEYTNGSVLILAPLAVSAQTAREGTKLGVEVTVARTAADLRKGINVTNYERLHLFDPGHFAGVVLDESSILKSFMGKTKRALVDAFSRHRFRLACTATPAPNDHLELGNHSEFLGVMPSHEMIARFFVNDPMQAGNYRVKGHAEGAFWNWVHSWAVSVGLPSDIGHSDEGFILPPLNIEEHPVSVDQRSEAGEGRLFRDATLSATTMHREMRRTAGQRADRVAELVSTSGDPWLLWCNTNYEADELRARIPDAVDVRGSMSLDEKEEALLAFAEGKVQRLLTKPSIAGFGMNFQHCHNMAFVGLSYSYEQLYQAIRRCWRFGQKHPVTAHVIFAETEGAVFRAIREKQADHEEMKNAMRKAMRQTHLGGGEESRTRQHDGSREECGVGWRLVLGDSCQVLPTIGSESVGLSVFSPPFSNLYTYSDHLEDMGNSYDDDEFFKHFAFIIRELLRITIPGRLAAIHCKDLPRYMGRDGAAGLSDFPGRIVRAFEAEGWQFHSRVTIWKCPVTEMQRTKNHGLLYKELKKDSCSSRMGMADYVLAFRKWTDIEEWPNPVTHTEEDFPLDQWQAWASPVWMDIDQTDVLPYQAAKEERDERHICPLQLGVIERCVKLWSNPWDTVLSPFAGIGSEGYEALRLGRKFFGVELKETYWRTACRNLRMAVAQPSLFPGPATGATAVVP